MIELRYPTKEHKLVRRFLDFVKLLPFTALVKNRTYSQLAEDLLIRSKLQSGIGTYLDIGSGLPCWGNNTYSLYRSGWTGVLVDPINKNIKLSRFFRRKDLSICAAVGQTPGVFKFYKFEPYELSTLDAKVYESRVNGNFGRFLRSYDIPVVTLSDLFQKMDLVHPIVLSIDTEGYEMQVLMGNDWKKYVPDLVCIEEWSNPIEIKTEVREFLEHKGYILQIYNGLSSIYTR